MQSLEEDKSKEAERLFETAFINPDKEDIKDTKDNDSFSDNIEAIPYTVIQEYKVIFRFTGNIVFKYKNYYQGYEKRSYPAATFVCNHSGLLLIINLSLLLRCPQVLTRLKIL